MDTAGAIFLIVNSNETPGAFRKIAGVFRKNSPPHFAKTPGAFRKIAGDCKEDADDLMASASPCDSSILRPVQSGLYKPPRHHRPSMYSRTWRPAVMNGTPMSLAMQRMR